MARSYRLEDVVAKRKQQERALEERLTAMQNKNKLAQRDLRKRNRATAGRILERDGFLDLPSEEFNAGLHLWGVIRELGLLSDRAEAERRLREPSGRSALRKEDMLVSESVAALASAAE